jgi:carboxymethylenebutenolidase
VIERKFDIAMKDGDAEAILYRPDDERACPGVLFLTDIFGIRPANQGMAQRLAAKGYAVLMPNVFYRHGKIPLLDFEFKMGEARSMKLMGALFAAEPNDRMGPDGALYADFLLAQKGVSGTKIGVVGYCFSGAMALRTAAETPDRIAAAASFHGGRLVTDAADSPHLLLPKVKARLYFGHAIEDQSMTADNIKTLEAALEKWGGKYRSETYQGALHGWTVPGRNVYNEPQAEVAFDRLTELLRKALDQP